MIRQLQCFLKDTQFFRVLEELIQINGYGGQYYFTNATKEEDIFPSLDNRRFILQFLFLIMQNDPEILCLIMN